MANNISQDVTDRVSRYVQQVPEYRLVVCSECQHAVWPTESRSHFKGPKHDIPPETVTEIVEIIKSWTQSIQYPIQLEVPAFVEQAVPLLEVYRDGLQ